jgi:hypothetical protein
MGQPKKKSGSRCLYTTRTQIDQDGVRRVICRHPIVGEEPTRYLVDSITIQEVDGKDVPCPPEYADRAELKSRGFTGGTDAAGNKTSNIYCCSKKATRAATLWLREMVRKSLGWPEPTKYPDDSAPVSVKVTHYAEVVCGILTELSQVHRGVWDLEDGTLVVFGNDASLEDRRFEHEVDMFRRRSAEAGLAEELGYAISRDGESWALLVRRPEGGLPDEPFIDLLRTMVWDAWFDACQIALL